MIKTYKSSYCSGGINIFNRKNNTTQLVTIDYGVDYKTQERVMKPLNEWVDYKKMNVLQRVSVMNLLQKTKEEEFKNKYKK